MKTRAAVLALGLILCVPAFAGDTKHQPGGNRAPDTVVPIPNADLEEGGDGPSQWKFGHGDGGSGTWSWDTENVHSGKRAFRIQRTNSTGYSYLNTGLLPVEAGKKYELAAWVKLRQPTEAPIYFMVCPSQADHSALRPNLFSDRQQRYRAGEWQRVTFRFTAPDTAGHVTV